MFETFTGREGNTNSRCFIFFDITHATLTNKFDIWRFSYRSTILLPFVYVKKTNKLFNLQYTYTKHKKIILKRERLFDSGNGMHLK